MVFNFPEPNTARDIDLLTQVILTLAQHQTSIETTSPVCLNVVLTKFHVDLAFALTHPFGTEFL